MRVAIYARVSSDKQRDRHTIESQLTVLAAFVKTQGWELVDTYVDDGKTAKAGHLEKRDGWTHLLADMRASKFDVVAMVDLDRLTRSEDIEEQGRILGAFQRAGVAIATPSEGIVKLDNFSDIIRTQIRAQVGAEENRKRRERVTRGRQEAARRGRPSARPPLGLRFDRAAAAWGFDEHADLVREMFARVASGVSCGDVAIALAKRGLRTPRGNEWTRASVYQIVENPAYRGEWIADRQQRIVIAVPALVDQDLWYQAQESMASGKLRGLRRTKHVYLLEAIARCALCEAPIHIHDPMSNGQRTPYYACSRRRKPRAYGDTCALPMRRVELVDARVWSAIAELVARPDLLAEVIDSRRFQAGKEARSWEQDLHDYEARLERVAQLEQAAVDRFHRGLLSDAAYDAELGRCARERKLLERQVVTARQSAAGARQQVGVVAGVVASFDLLRARLAQPSAAAQREIVRTLVPGRGEYFAELGAESIELFANLGAVAAAVPVKLVA